jgi:hypothetical protein
MNQSARSQIILFRGEIGSIKTCHKKAYDHAPEGARTSGVAFGGGRIAGALRQRRILLSASA